MNVDDINNALERVEQDALRHAAKRASRNGGVPLFFGDSDQFDKIAAADGSPVVVRRCHHAKLLTIPDGEYGS